MCPSLKQHYVSHGARLPTDVMVLGDDNVEKGAKNVYVPCLHFAEGKKKAGLSVTCNISVIASLCFYGAPELVGNNLIKTLHVL